MRLVIFYLLLIFSQSLLGAVFVTVAPPDLFLIGVLTLLWRLPPWQLVIIAFAAGLLQDILGAGFLGLHALGLAGGMLAALVVRAQLSQVGVFERALTIMGAVAGKWLAIVPLLIWQTGSWQVVREVLDVSQQEMVLTLLAGLVLLPWAEALMERARFLQKELL